MADDHANKLTAQFKLTLGEKVEDVVVSKRLVESPVTLVAGQSGMDAQMERMLKMMDQNYVSASKILEVNPGHQLIKNLSRMIEEHESSEIVDKVIFQLYEGALLLDGNLNQTTDYVSRMTDLMVKATS